VPFAEVHRAVGVIALQDFKISLGLWVLELEYPKHLCRWDVWVRLLLINLKLLIQANLASLNDFDFGAPSGNLIPNALVLDLVAVDHLAFLITMLVVLLADASTVESSATAR
jgi:hypothetical protein